MSASANPPNGTSTPLLDSSNFPQSLATDKIHVELCYTPLDTPSVLSSIRSPSCGANVLFLGTTRDSSDNRPVSKLAYSAYPALALKSFKAIAEKVVEEHGLGKVCIVHRLGHVPVGEESIAVAVSAAHRGPAWRGAEEALERCKERAEVWKMEVFGDEEGGGEWRANRERCGEGRKRGQHE